MHRVQTVAWHTTAAGYNSSQTCYANLFDLSATVYVYTEYPAVLMYGTHRLGVESNSMLLAARLLSL